MMYLRESTATLGVGSAGPAALVPAAAPAIVGRARPRALFICGSINQTTQMHKVASCLGEVDAWFTPYYSDHWLMQLGHVLWMQEWSIMGHKMRRRCMKYLQDHRLAIDLEGRAGAAAYDVVFTCSDLVLPPNMAGRPMIVVQEGILDRPNFLTTLAKNVEFLPRFFGGTAMTGLSGGYDRLCAASEGYRQYFIDAGAPPDRVVVTGMPNFDQCDAYYDNDFPHRGYVLACTSDARETFKFDDRIGFISEVLRIAAGRPLIFKLHPNERIPRAVREIARHAPGSLIYSRGSAEQMVANCDVFVAQWSSLAFVAMALGKTVHSYFPLEELQRLMPWQNGGQSAANIAHVCRELIGLPVAAAR